MYWFEPNSWGSFEGCVDVHAGSPSSKFGGGGSGVGGVELEGELGSVVGEL